MPSNKHIPTELISKFKAKNPTLRRIIQMDLKSHGKKEKIGIKSRSEQIFSLTKLPILPCPSTELTEILFQFNDLNFYAQNYHNVKKQKAGNPKKKFRSINGFIAFRSFYSRLVANPEHQRKLSIMLGKLWSQEPSRQIWNRYASEYNMTCHKHDNKVAFVDWLCDTLNLNTSMVIDPNTNIVRNNNWKFSSSSSESIVEDIYFYEDLPLNLNFNSSESV